MDKRPTVSVIIPVDSSQAVAHDFLRPFIIQDYPSELTEVIVIVDGTDRPLQIPLVQGIPNLRIVRQKKSNSYTARNLGIQLSKGTVIALTDVDCCVSPEWISQGILALKKGGEIDIIGGAICFSFQRPLRPNIFEIYDSLTFLQQKRLIENHRFAATANLFVRRDVFERIGLFDTASPSGGDGEFGRRAAAAGYVTHYAPNTIVTHPARKSFAELKQKWQRVMRGFFDFQNKQYRWGGNQTKLYRWTIAPVKIFVEKVIAARGICSTPRAFLVGLLAVIFLYRAEVELIRLHTTTQGSN